MFFDYSILPPEIQHLILDYTIISEPTSKKASSTIHTLYNTNTNIRRYIDNPRYTDDLIKKLAQKHFCSHETIAKRLCTQQAKKQLILQYHLKDLCCLPPYNNQATTLDELISEKVDLEFTYNHYHYQKTPLMIAMDYNNGMFQHFLYYGVNINSCNSHGMTALHLACKEKPVDYVWQLISRPEIIVNQQDNAGKNALFYCLVNRKRVSKRIFAICTALLSVGCDLECTNNKGITPLMIAHGLLSNGRLIKLMNRAIKERSIAINS